MKYFSYPSKIKKPQDNRLETNAIINKVKLERPLGIPLIDPTPNNIAKEVCTYFNVEFEEFISTKRQRYIIDARHAYFYLCRKLTKNSYIQIGRSFGMNFDHATVLSAIRKVAGYCEVGNDYAVHIRELMKKFQA